MDFEGWSRKRVFDGRGFDAQLPVGSCVLHGENLLGMCDLRAHISRFALWNIKQCEEILHNFRNFRVTQVESNALALSVVPTVI